MSKKTLFDTLIVVKRSGQRTSFQGEKIAIAIQKAFNSIDIPYQDEEVNKVYEQVLNHIQTRYQDRKTINIENIQDIIEETLKSENFLDVYQAFSTYRNHRNASRKAFVTKQQHKFLKAIEALGLTNIEEENKTPQQLLDKFGSIISLEFAKAYLLDNKLTRAHDGGIIHLHSIETMPMGSIDNIEIDLSELATLDTSLGKILQAQTTIEGYLMHVSYLLAQLHQEQYGAVCFIHFDTDLAVIAYQQFCHIFLQQFQRYLTLQELITFFPFDSIQQEIEKANSIEQIQALLTSQFENQPKLQMDIKLLIKETLQDISNILKQALYSFFATLPAVDLSINFGTNITQLGKIVIDSLIKSAPLTNCIQYFFKIKKGISFKATDPNYDLLLAYEDLAMRQSNCFFTFLEATFNRLEKEEICYLNDGRRIIEDNTTLEKRLVGGKGNLATVSINLVRIALQCQQQNQGKRQFYQLLEQNLTLAKDALLTIFELQCNKHCSNFPTLYEQGIWHDGEKVKDTERLRKLLKHGSLTIHFCGLKETMLLLDPNKKLENNFNLALEIIKFIHNRLTQFSETYNLNFSLSTVAFDSIASEFKKQDTAIFGKIDGITDKDIYSRGDDLPFTLKELGKLQNYLNGGHVTVVTANKKTMSTSIEEAYQANIGCLQIRPE